MKTTTLLTAALVGVASADIFARDVIMAIPSDVLKGMPKDCRKKVDAVTSILPAEPTAIEKHSSSFYKTATRTATATDEDCAWITGLPNSVHVPYLNYYQDLIDLVVEPSFTKLSQEADQLCGEFDLKSDSCLPEWDEFLVKAIVLSGWEPTSPNFPNFMASGIPESPESSGSVEIPESSGGVDNPETTEDADASNEDKDDDSAASGMVAQTYAVAALLAAFVGGAAMI